MGKFLIHRIVILSSIYAFFLVPLSAKRWIFSSAQQVEGNHPTLLIDGDGNFNSKFVDDLKLAAVSRPVAVVSVFGVQSTGNTYFSWVHLKLLFTNFHPSQNLWFGTNYRQVLIYAGKSTLMNSLFSTKFKVMDASQGMYEDLIQFLITLDFFLFS